MRIVKIVFGIALVFVLVLLACEKEIPMPYGDGMAEQSQVTDSDLDKQVGIPNRLGVTKVVVTGFPVYKENGEFWDSDEGLKTERFPDIFVVINNAMWKVPDVLSTEMDYKKNAIPGTDYGWKFGRSIEIVEPNLMHRIALYDYDDLSKSHQLMHEANFIPFSGANGYPQSIEINSDIASYTIELDYR